MSALVTLLPISCSPLHATDNYLVPASPSLPPLPAPLSPSERDHVGGIPLHHRRVGDRSED